MAGNSTRDVRWIRLRWHPFKPRAALKTSELQVQRAFPAGSAVPRGVRPADRVLLLHRLCAVLRSRPEPPARRPARFRSQPAGSLEHVTHSCPCYFTVRIMRQASNASKLQPADTAATNSWLLCFPCGRRFAAEAGTRRTCHVEPRFMMACPGRCEAKTMCGSVWISPQRSVGAHLRQGVI
jgi:hypothetical protein